MAKRMQYGEETVVMRVPKSMVGEVKMMMENRKVIESTKVQISKDDPQVQLCIDAFMQICNAQMVELLNSSEVELISKGELDKARSVSSMKLEFTKQATIGPLVFEKA
jgi:hypothetical protein